MENPIKTNAETRVIGTVKVGNRITGLLVSSESQDMFEKAFSGRLRAPIYITAVPVIFALYQGNAEIVYEKD
jgi:hypothetical protein